MVLTLGDAVNYYRSRTVHQLIDGDHVWMPATTAVREGFVVPVVTLRAHPNPFKPRTVITYDLALATDVRVGIYDLAGRLVRNLVVGHQPLGPHALTWDGCDDRGRGVGAGVYFLRVNAGGGGRTEKLVLIR